MRAHSENARAFFQLMRANHAHQRCLCIELEYFSSDSLSDPWQSTARQHRGTFRDTQATSAGSRQSSREHTGASLPDSWSARAGSLDGL